MDQEEVRVIILHVNRLFRECIAFILAQQNAISVVRTAGRFDQTECELASVQPNLFLLDFGGPDRTGLEDARQIRAVSSEFKILMMGVPGNEGDVLACIECGSAGYLLRDASVENLIGNVRAVVAGETLCSPRIASLAFSHIARHARQANEFCSGNSSQLTRRELEIVESIEEGLSNKEIAVRLHIELSTVKNHVHNILYKLHSRDRRSAVQHVKRDGLIASRF